MHPNLVPIPIRRRPDQLLHNLIIIPILTINLGVVDLQGLLTLEHIDVELVYLARVGAQDLVAVLVHPGVEDRREELGVPAFQLVLVDFCRLVQVVFYRVPDCQQVYVQFAQLFQGPVLGILFGLLKVFVLLLQLNLNIGPDNLNLFLPIIGKSIIDPDQIGQIHIGLKNPGIGLVGTFLIMQYMTKKHNFKLIHMKYFNNIHQDAIGVALNLRYFMDYLVSFEGYAVAVVFGLELLVLGLGWVGGGLVGVGLLVGLHFLLFLQIIQWVFYYCVGVLYNLVQID